MKRGAPEWLGRLGDRFSSGYDLLGLWARAPCWALCWQCEACLRFSIPLPPLCLFPAQALSLSLSLILSVKINKLKKKVRTKRLMYLLPQYTLISDMVIFVFTYSIPQNTNSIIRFPLIFKVNENIQWPNTNSVCTFFEISINFRMA